jgi:hypothetical protein
MKIVPGHGPVGTKAQIREYRQMLVNARDQIAKAIAAGMTEDQVVAAKPNADYDTKLRLSFCETSLQMCLVGETAKIDSWTSGTSGT